jgi:hypothetical protein
MVGFSLGADDPLSAAVLRSHVVKLKVQMEV